QADRAVISFYLPENDRYTVSRLSKQRNCPMNARLQLVTSCNVNRKVDPVLRRGTNAGPQHLALAIQRLFHFDDHFSASKYFLRCVDNFSPGIAIFIVRPP